MLTGRRAVRRRGRDRHARRRAAGRDPDWSALPADTPAPSAAAAPLPREGSPSDRLRDIGDARLELEDPGSLAPDAALPPAGSRGVYTHLADRHRASGADDDGRDSSRYQTPALRPTPVRFQVMPPGNLQFSSGAVGRAAAAVPVISPDGRTWRSRRWTVPAGGSCGFGPIDSVTAQPLPAPTAPAGRSGRPTAEASPTLPAAI